MRSWPSIIHSPILLLMISCRYLSSALRARRAFIRLRSSLSMYPKETMNGWYNDAWCLKFESVEQNAPLSRKSRVNITLTMEFMTHVIAKIGPPIDRDRFKMSAIWLATVKSLVRKRAISLNDFHASLALTSCLLPASVNKGAHQEFKNIERWVGLYLVK